MTRPSDALIHHERWWPDDFDDSEIDALIWPEIEHSSSPGDFACYLAHRLLKARHVDVAQARFDYLSESGDSQPLHYFQAIAKIRQLAEQGHAGAMFHMGKVHALGLAVERDMAEAARWYRGAADKGDMRAHCNLGWMYQSGMGVPEDKAEAFRLLSIGADHGVLSAKAAAGMMLLTGEGCEADAQRALHMLEAAFEAGYLNAGNCISDAYLAGTHLPQDVEQGHAWLGKVAASGDARSMAILGHYLITGSHGKTDVTHGIALMYDAINHGYAPAYAWLGALYEKGQGLERDLGRAQAWYERGVAAGDETSSFALKRLKQQVMPETTSHSVH
jgi:TPR repeat protein